MNAGETQRRSGKEHFGSMWDVAILEALARPDLSKPETFLTAS